MELSRKEIFNRTKHTIKLHTNRQLIRLLEATQIKVLDFLFFLNWEVDYIKKSTIEEHNPIIWEAIHPIFFMEKHCLRYIDTKHKYEYDPRFTNNIYDSFIIPSEERYKQEFPSFSEIKKYYSEINNKIKHFIEHNIIDGSEYYLIMLVITHLHMHIESFIFTNQLVYKIAPFCLSESINANTSGIIKLNFVDIKGGNFTQGYNTKKIGFDNEKPCFKKEVPDFSVSKTLITFHMFLQFYLEGGYDKDELWSFRGNIWKKNNDIKCPLYWEFINKKIYINYFARLMDIETIYNFPIINISWYEAEAFCKWKGVRLITESEWEYLVTNGSTTLYPWGDDEERLYKCNINYSNKWITSVKSNTEDLNNLNGVEQLIGNCWEWCQETIYPYDNFKIDPVYREMSYPFFGQKKICKGGAWCVPDFMITSSYRNAQMPDCRKQFIGFRCAKL